MSALKKTFLSPLYTAIESTSAMVLMQLFDNEATNTSCKNKTTLSHDNNLLPHNPNCSIYSIGEIAGSAII